MPSKHHCINISVEPALYADMHSLAESKGVSISMIARDLLKESFELFEDLTFSKLAEEREKTIRHYIALTHKQTWE
jgi:hypothetical protein